MKGFIKIALLSTIVLVHSNCGEVDCCEPATRITNTLYFFEIQNNCDYDVTIKHSSDSKNVDNPIVVASGSSVEWSSWAFNSDEWNPFDKVGMKNSEITITYADNTTIRGDKLKEGRGFIGRAPISGWRSVGSGPDYNCMYSERYRYTLTNEDYEWAKSATK